MNRNRILNRSPKETTSFRFTEAERQTLLELALSGKAANRKQCAQWIECCSYESINLPVLLELADLLIPDRMVRWSILCSLTHFTETNPEKLWPLIVKWGSVYNPDIRRGVACCLLEHILDHHFEEYFERSRQIILEGNRRFGPTLSACTFGCEQVSEHARRFKEFVSSLRLRKWKTAK